MTLTEKISRVARLHGSFVLRSGKTSNWYFDKYRFESDPVLLKEIAEAMVPLLPKDAEVLAGLEMGGIPVVTVLSQVTGLPAAFIRKEAKTYGTCNYAEGIDLEGKKVVIIEDVVTSGGAILEAVNKMRDDGYDVDTAVCVIDRQQGGKEKLAAAGIELISLIKMDEVENSADKMLQQH